MQKIPKPKSWLKIGDHLVRNPEYGKWYRLTHRKQMDSYQKSYRQRNRTRIEQYKKNWRKSKREEIISLLGSKCIKCGNSEKEVLQIDHIKGGGTKLFKKYGTELYSKILREIKNGSKDYQLLCGNCNIKKAIERGERSSWN